MVLNNVATRTGGRLWIFAVRLAHDIQIDTTYSSCRLILTNTIGRGSQKGLLLLIGVSHDRC
jgi:hypothetical protein